MKKGEYRKEFLRLFGMLNRKYSNWDLWNDLLFMIAASLSNAFPSKDRDAREKQYLNIINQYEKEEIELFPQMFAAITLELEENPEQDLMGSLYHELNLHQKQKGQFFTPYDVSRFMAKINTESSSLETVVERQGYISVCDPACGAGSLLIAFANESRKSKINFQKHVLFVAQDIDRTAALMCYIQLSLLGCNAIVIIGDSLGKPGFHPDNDIWYTPMYHCNEWRFLDFFMPKSEKNTEEVTTVNEDKAEKNILENATIKLELTTLDNGQWAIAL